MPDPRHMKDTGDVHPPEVEDDSFGDEPAAGTAELQSAPRERRVRERTVEAAPEPSRAMRFSAPTERVLDSAREQVRRKPIAYAAGAFAVGFVLAIITR